MATILCAALRAKSEHFGAARYRHAQNVHGANAGFGVTVTII
jgi:hypothetical protein